MTMIAHSARPLHIAHDGFLVGYARLLGDGRAVWYPGRSQVGCVRMASELDVWREEELLDGETFALPAAVESDPPEDMDREYAEIIQYLLGQLARLQQEREEALA